MRAAEAQGRHGAREKRTSNGAVDRAAGDPPSEQNGRRSGSHQGTARTIPSVSEADASKEEGGAAAIAGGSTPGRLRRAGSALFAALRRHHRQHTAQALAFDFFLALVPMVALAGWAGARLLEGRGAFSPTLSVFSGLPHQVRTFLENTTRTLAGVDVAPIALGSGLWLSSSAFATFLSVVHDDVRRERSAIVTRLIAIGLALVGLVVLALASSVGLFLVLDTFGVLARFFPLLETPWFLRATLVLLGLAAMTTFIALLYRVTFGSAKTAATIWVGALSASLLGSFGSLLLVVFSTRFGNHALFYGGLAAVVALLLWLWGWSWALLFGAQLALALTAPEEPRRDSPPE